MRKKQAPKDPAREPLEGTKSLLGWLRPYEQDAGGMDFDQFVKNTHPHWKLAVTYRIEGVGLMSSYTETRILAPGESLFLYCDNTDPAPGRYVGYEILDVSRARANTRESE